MCCCRRLKIQFQRIQYNLTVGSKLEREKENKRTNEQASELNQRDRRIEVMVKWEIFEKLDENTPKINSFHPWYVYSIYTTTAVATAAVILAIRQT